MAYIFDPILRRLRKKDAATVDDDVEINISDVVGLSNALDSKVNTLAIGSAGGVPSLGLDGKIPVGQVNFNQAIVTIPSATTEYTLADGVYIHTPSSATVYTLSSVEDETVTHDVRLTVKCIDTQSIGFQDENGNIIVPLGDIYIQYGDVVEYLCQYDPLQGKWAIVGGYLNA